MLIVDDCEVNIAILEGVLKHHNIQSEFVMSGAAALKKLEERLRMSNMFNSGSSKG